RRDLVKAKEAAEASARATSAFLATMSHEIRTPLNAVIGMAGLLADEELTDEQREFAEIIHTSGDHLLALINDILDYSKLEAGRLQLENLAFGVSNVLEEVLDMVAGKARDKGLELAHEVAPDVPRFVIGDAGRVRQVLVNYLGNAIK